MKAIVVGCGISGIVSAILLKEKGYEVEIFDTRSHIGGNCYDHEVEGVRVHKYGPHGFHTNNENVWSFLNRYSKFNDVCLKAKANTKEGIIPIPYSPETEKIIGYKTPEEIQDLIFKDYSEKMWGIPWEELPKSISGRLPNKREDPSECFHLDTYQGIPENGYTSMFKNMLNSIKVNLNCKPKDYQNKKYDILIYTGKIDEFFDYCYGWLEYRSLKIQFETAKPRPDLFQLNECNDWNSWTRSVDHSHWHKQKLNQTVISREYPCEHDKNNLPFYPKPFGSNPEKYKKYKKIADRLNDVIFVGRLATYKYLDMDDAVAQVFTKLNKI
jgi:UDP-galactopyranose mutase